MVKQYTLKYGPVTEVSTIVSLSLGAKVVCVPKNGKWMARVRDIGYGVTADDYKTAMDKCIEAFQTDINRRVRSGEPLPVKLTTDWRVFFEEDD